MCRPEPQIAISNPPAGPFDADCPNLIIRPDFYGGVERKLFFIPANRLDDLLQGQSIKAGVSHFAKIKHAKTATAEGQAASKKRKRDTESEGQEAGVDAAEDEVGARAAKATGRVWDFSTCI
jgi:hypothetical protein